MATPVNPEKDGHDHINVYSRGKTWLGRMLSNFADTPFALPEDGAFRSVEGYWYWLSSRDDRLRTLAGYKAKKIGREARGKSPLQVPDFHTRILLATNAKLLAHPDIAEALRRSWLPLLHYYDYSGTVRLTSSADFILYHLVKCRKSLQTNQPLPVPVVEPQPAADPKTEPQPVAAKKPAVEQFDLF